MTNNSKSAEHTRNYRKRLKEQGFLKHEIYVPSRFKDIIKKFETCLREGITPIFPEKMKGLLMEVKTKTWNVESLKTEIDKNVSSEEIATEVVDENSMIVNMKEYGDLALVVTIIEDQILVSRTLVKVSSVKDPVEFNKILLKMNKPMPLSSFGITNVNGEDWYEIFGALSASSTFQSIEEELNTLAENTLDVVDDMEEYFI